MSEAVARLPTAQREAPSPAPALGFSLQVDLGAGRVCTLQTHLPGDCHFIELNLMLDKMTAAGDRQRAHYKLEELERDLAKLEKEQSQHQEDLERVDRDFDEQKQKRIEAIAKAEKALADFEIAAGIAATERGRRNPNLTSQDRANARKTKGGIDQLKGEITAAQAERDKTMADSQKTIERRAELIEKTCAEIARCKEIVKAGLQK
jgi:hypothetical protein